MGDRISFSSDVIKFSGNKVAHEDVKKAIASEFTSLQADVKNLQQTSTKKRLPEKIDFSNGKNQDRIVSMDFSLMYGPAVFKTLREKQAWRYLKCCQMFRAVDPFASAIFLKKAAELAGVQNADEAFKQITAPYHTGFEQLESVGHRTASSSTDFMKGAEILCFYSDMKHVGIVKRATSNPQEAEQHQKEDHNLFNSVLACLGKLLDQKNDPGTLDFRRFECLKSRVEWRVLVYQKFEPDVSESVPKPAAKSAGKAKEPAKPSPPLPQPAYAVKLVLSPMHPSEKILGSTITVSAQKKSDYSHYISVSFKDGEESETLMLDMTDDSFYGIAVEWKIYKEKHPKAVSDLDKKSLRTPFQGFSLALQRCATPF